MPRHHNPEDLITTSVPQQPLSRTLFCHIGSLYESSGTGIYIYVYISRLESAMYLYFASLCATVAKVML